MTHRAGQDTDAVRHGDGERQASELRRRLIASHRLGFPVQATVLVTEMHGSLLIHSWPDGANVFAERLIAMARRLQSRVSGAGSVVGGKVVANPNDDENTAQRREP